MTRCTRCGAPEDVAVEPEDCESCANKNPFGLQARIKLRITDHGDGTFTLDGVHRDRPGALGFHQEIAGTFTETSCDEDDYIRREQELMARGYRPEFASSPWFVNRVINEEGTR